MCVFLCLVATVRCWTLGGTVQATHAQEQNCECELYDWFRKISSTLLDLILIMMLIESINMNTDWILIFIWCRFVCFMRKFQKHPHFWIVYYINPYWGLQCIFFSSSAKQNPWLEKDSKSQRTMGQQEKHEDKPGVSCRLCEAVYEGVAEHRRLWGLCDLTSHLITTWIVLWLGSSCPKPLPVC